MISTDPEWEWANNEAMRAPLKSAQTAVESLLLKSMFAKRVLSQDAATIKKDMEAPLFISETHAFKKAFEGPIKTLQQQVGLLQGQHKVRLAYKAEESG